MTQYEIYDVINTLTRPLGYWTCHIECVLENLSTKPFKELQAPWRPSVLCQRSRRWASAYQMGLKYRAAMHHHMWLYNIAAVADVNNVQIRSHIR